MFSIQPGGSLILSAAFVDDTGVAYAPSPAPVVNVYTIASDLTRTQIVTSATTTQSSPAVTGEYYYTLSIGALALGTALDVIFSTTDASLSTPLRSRTIKGAARYLLSASELADGAITAAKIASDAIGSAQLAASGVSEIQSGLATAISNLQTHGDATWATGGSAPTVSEIVDAMDADSTQLARIAAKTDLIGDPAIHVRVPTTDTGMIELVVGDDYFLVDSRAFEFEFDGFPSLVGGTCKLRLTNDRGVTLGDAVVGVITSSTELYFQPTTLQTALVKRATHFEVEVTLANSHIVTLIPWTSGTVVVTPQASD